MQLQLLQVEEFLFFLQFHQLLYEFDQLLHHMQKMHLLLQIQCHYEHVHLMEHLITSLTFFTKLYIPIGRKNSNCIWKTNSVYSCFFNCFAHTLIKNSGSALLPSSTVNLIFNPCDFAYSTVSTAL